MTHLNIPVPPALDAAIAERVARGDYVDVADYARDVLRRDLATDTEERAWVRAMVQEGIDSGIIEDKDAFEVLQDIIDEDPDLRD